jgi:hypothetical protein
LEPALVTEEIVFSPPHADAGQATLPQQRSIAALLWCLVTIGMTRRALQPFIQNPLDWLQSDPGRFFRNALRPWSHDILNIIEPAGLQIWLGAILRICGNSRVSVGVCYALLSLITPWLYYKWMKESLPTPTLALAGFAVISCLPTWTLFTSYFMQETLLVTLIGASLWTSWRAARLHGDGLSLYAAAACWGFAIMTKVTVLSLAALVWAWLAWRIVRPTSSPRCWATLAMATALLALLTSVNTIKVYNRIHEIVWIPQAAFNRAYFESGKAQIVVTWLYTDSVGPPERRQQSSAIGTATIFDAPFAPFSDWRMPREDVLMYVIDYRDHQYDTPPLQISWHDRARYMLYNAIYFFWGGAWPISEGPLTQLDRLAPLSRWIWFPLTLVLLIHVALSRRLTPLSFFCLVYLGVFLVQQVGVMEGRYRMAWEGLAIAAFLERLSFARSPSELEPI